MARISLENLSKSYGALTVIRDIDLHIDDGEMLVLVGPSGCGKSTLLRMIAGLETVSSGTIRIDGKRVNDIDPATGTSPWCSRATRSIRTRRCSRTSPSG
jgi:carbohydrate ABC transporter ATP-binding protein, CUT1 family (TC 3.A.1.1.-)